MTTLISGRIRRKSSALVRWRMRGLLRLLPAHSAEADSAPPQAGDTASERFRIAYMFTGTYGDFVQILRPLNRLAAAFPNAEIRLHGADRYAREFSSELPPGLSIAHSFDPFRWILDPVELLLTNCVGVYRVRLDFAARFCARRAFGFRHSHEARRGGYAATIPLLPEVRSFAEENLKVLDLAGVPQMWGLLEKRGRSTEQGEALFPGEPVPAWGKGKILFHIGSAGLKRDFGLKAYTRLVFGILSKLDGSAVEVVMGPGDEDIALEVRSGTGFVPQMFPLSRLIRILRSFEGTVLCFNSFPAHICHYLGRSAVVLHRDAIPYGYDCAPLHRQVVLSQDKGWDLGEVWDALRAEKLQ